MAFSVRISGISKGSSEVSLSMEPSWWKANQLMDDDRFVESNDTGSYFDYDADMTLVEMRVLHEAFKEAATTGIYGGEGWQKMIKPELKRLDEALYSEADEYSHFHVTVFEWESGMD